MDERLIAEVTSLRHALHACPELSGQERVTRATLEGWLRERLADWRDGREG